MDGDKELSRPELVQKLWKYIKGNDLQDPADRRFILCDEKLKKIFDQDRINSFGMNKDLSAHLTKKEEPISAGTTDTDATAADTAADAPPVENGELLLIQTTDLPLDPIVQQEPTPSKDDTPTEDDFLL
ncbi:SWIB/MDM2 domain-containing protein [Mucor mucedo]|uniref:SWIB/MDM2 domain-containing protein n=1 Tax=Mucor mucedo TaxID=29922 RepID=UPI00221EAEA5|nr:SWIB/MDM2 domain-containing protein [Mucor mucedo]KAI7895801.1 SWIB/MDM2 domain-containing protein [Mucor mucedo]